MTALAVGGPRPTATWRGDALRAVVIAAGSSTLGAALGLIWHALAPGLDIAAANRGSDAAPHALLSDDLLLGVLGVVAGICCVAAVLLLDGDRGNGPGAAIGLVAGGVLGALVAAHVGHAVGHRDFADAVATMFPGAPRSEVAPFVAAYDFKVRAAAVLLGWPVAAALVHAVVIGRRGRIIGG